MIVICQMKMLKSGMKGTSNNFRRTNTNMKKTREPRQPMIQKLLQRQSRNPRDSAGARRQMPQSIKLLTLRIPCLKPLKRIMRQRRSRNPRDSGGARRQMPQSIQLLTLRILCLKPLKRIMRQRRSRNPRDSGGARRQMPQSIKLLTLMKQIMRSWRHLLRGGQQKEGQGVVAPVASVLQPASLKNEPDVRCNLHDKFREVASVASAPSPKNEKAG